MHRPGKPPFAVPGFDVHPFEILVNVLLITQGKNHSEAKGNIRSTALSKAFSSIPTCGYVDRRDKLIII
jgi:hypothetical protein